MKSYHFDVGNSSTGPIGLCARITANSPEEALEILKDHLPVEGLMIADDKWSDAGPGTPHVEYIQAYFNDAAITVKDIDDEEEVVEEGEE